MSKAFPSWLTQWMLTQDIPLWNAANLRDMNPPQDIAGQPFPMAISMAVPMNPRIMDSIQDGPNRSYADEYSRVNARINKISSALAAEIQDRGYHALALAASDRTDKENIKGDFPHKTAATRAGIGWIGRHCQLITREFGPWVRLGTVFTDMPMPGGAQITRGFCGKCVRCVEACPARAIKGKAWQPGIAREAMLDVRLCDRWKKENYFQYHNGHNCGICAAVCPYGAKTLKRH